MFEKSAYDEGFEQGYEDFWKEAGVGSWYKKRVKKQEIEENKTPFRSTVAGAAAGGAGSFASGSVGAALARKMLKMKGGPDPMMRKLLGAMAVGGAIGGAVRGRTVGKMRREAYASQDKN